MILLLTSIILSLFALLLSRVLGKKNPGQSSLYTAGMILVLVALPFSLFLPKLQVETSLLNTAAITLPSQSTGMPWATVFIVIWSIGSLALLIRLVCHYNAVRLWRKNSERCTTPQWTHRLHECCKMLEMDTIPSLSISNEIYSPIVTGLIYPQILLPNSMQEWSEDTINHVLLHELGHIKRRDLWISVASHIACALHWFNPIVWMLRKHQATQCEFACDSFVLSAGANAKSYIHAICDVAETANKQPNVALALAMANKASLKQRVELLLEDQRPKGHTLTIALLLLSATTAFGINLVTPVQHQAQLIKEQQEYSPEEINTRHDANPFPGE